MRLAASIAKLMWRYRTPELLKSRSSSTKAYRIPFNRNLAVASAICGFVGGSIYLYMNQKWTDSEESFKPKNIRLKPTKQVSFSNDHTGLKLTLFQYQTCPFCSKVRAYLNYNGISYDVVEVNPVMRQQIQFSQWKKVPILIVEDKNGIHQINDSSMIISSLQSFMFDQSQLLSEIAKNYPIITYVNDKREEVTEIVNRYYLMYGEKQADKTDEELEDERKWRIWVDSTLVHTLSPNIYRTIAESFDAFHWFSEAGEWSKNFTKLEQYVVIYVGAIAMYFVGKRLTKKHGLKAEVRESVYDACKQWTKEVGEKPFRGGDSPDLADLATYGVLTAIEGCQTFQDVLTHTKIGEWYMRMKHEVDPVLTRPAVSTA